MCRISAIIIGISLFSLVHCQKEAQKDARLSIFNIIKFENSPCIGGTRNGTCFTAAECEDLGGIEDSDCADGFGVCCVVKLKGGMSTNVNQSYIVLETTDTIESGNNKITICPCTSDICRIKFDFTTFTMAGPAIGPGTVVTGTAAVGEGAAIGDCITDTFSITSPSGSSSPIICGTNTNQHMIIDSDGQGCSDVNIGIGTETFARNWDIMVTQYRCSDENAGPPGCLQYFNQNAGNFRSFNYPNNPVNTVPAANVVHLSSQHYSVCFRRNTGMINMCWTPCTNILPVPLNAIQASFGISNPSATATPPTSAVDSECSQDYITIALGEDQANAIISATIAGGLVTSPTEAKATGITRICGRYWDTFGNSAAALASISVCSSHSPFILGVNFDMDEMQNGAAADDQLNETNDFPGGILGFHLCFNQT